MYREFANPRPLMRTVLDCASLFIFNVARSLSAGTIRNNRLTLDMPTDVFKFLFAGKGIGVIKSIVYFGHCDGKLHLCRKRFTILMSFFLHLGL